MGMKVLALSVSTAALALIALPILKAQELPEGKGKETVKTLCSGCHGLEQVIAHRDDKAGWEGVVTYMVSRGMPATDEEYETIVGYLSTAFPPATKGK
jgi:mono/diheme cytochrome c family protein